MKRKCVLGVLKTEEGLRIKEEMQLWLEPFYDVETVEVDPPNNVEFELPFIKRACEVALENRESVLYLHTKGAAMPNRAQPIVREMWRRVFTNERDTYFKVVDEREEAAVSALFVAPKRKICWYNGFVLNVKAAENILKVLKVHEDRYWFEQSMLSEANVEVIGPLMYEESNQVWQMTERYIFGSQNEDAVPEGKLPVIVSLTSWKKRINTVGKTIKSILDHCNPYKIVLTLSGEEFPNMANDLPFDLLQYAREGKVEIQWVHGNVRSFKKVLYTLERYKNFPVVSADDDCLYKEDYVKVLYEKWLRDKKAIWTYKRDTNTKVFFFGHGPACLYPPNCFGEYGLLALNPQIVDSNHDDIYYGVLAKMMNIHVKQAVEDPQRVPYIFHDEIEGLSEGSEMDGVQCINLCIKNYFDFITRSRIDQLFKGV